GARAGRAGPGRAEAPAGQGRGGHHGSADHGRRGVVGATPVARVLGQPSLACAPPAALAALAGGHAHRHAAHRHSAAHAGAAARRAHRAAAGAEAARAGTGSRAGPAEPAGVGAEAAPGAAGEAAAQTTAAGTAAGEARQVGAGCAAERTATAAAGEAAAVGAEPAASAAAAARRPGTGVLQAAGSGPAARLPRARTVVRGGAEGGGAVRGGEASSAAGTAELGRAAAPAGEAAASAASTAPAAASTAVVTEAARGEVLLDVERVGFEGLFHAADESVHQLAGVLVIPAGVDEPVGHGVALGLVPVEDAVLVPGVERRVVVAVVGELGGGVVHLLQLVQSLLRGLALPVLDDLVGEVVAQLVGEFGQGVGGVLVGGRGVADLFRLQGLQLVLDVLMAHAIGVVRPEAHPVPDRVQLGVLAHSTLLTGS